MELDPVFLSRLQFAFVISFRMIFPVAAKPRAPETRAPASRLWPTYGARSVRRFFPNWPAGNFGRVLLPRRNP
jgi:hypothetical protein